MSGLITVPVQRKNLKLLSEHGVQKPRNLDIHCLFLNQDQVDRLHLLPHEKQLIQPPLPWWCHQYHNNPALHKLRLQFLFKSINKKLSTLHCLCCCNSFGESIYSIIGFQWKNSWIGRDLPYVLLVCLRLILSFDLNFNQKRDLEREREGRAKFW